MKLSFSTLGCPEFSWGDIYSSAKDFGFNGVEIRFLPKTDSSSFTKEDVLKSKGTLKKLGIEISCISSDCTLSTKESYNNFKEEILSYIDMAHELSVPYVRVLGDKSIYPQDNIIDDAVVIDSLKALAPYAVEKNVTLLIETNGVYSDSLRLRKILDEVASDNVAALWDMHHTFRMNNEAPETTIQNLSAYIKYTHIKDSVMGENGLEYRMMGEGDMPIKEMINALKSINYIGYITLEWVRVWSFGLETAGIAFPHFIDYMSKYTSTSNAPIELYSNRKNTGHYVFERDSLIDLTFSQTLDKMVDCFPDQPAFRFTTHDYTRTYSEFRDDVDKFAASLIALGVKKGDKVAVWATNVPQWYITFWASVKIGAILVTVNTAYKIHEAEYLLRQSDTHTLVMIDGYRDSDYVGIIRSICPELETADKNSPLRIKKLPFLRNIISIESKLPGCLHWEEAMALSDKVSLETVYMRAAMVQKHDVCNMQYTSGTTGFPKGVMLTHYNVVNNGKCIGDCMDLSTADKMMIHVPMFHCFGLVLAMTACMTHGSTMCPIPAFSPKLSLDCINKEKITCFHGVPTMFIAMLEHEDFKNTDFSQLRTGIMAGSPCPVKVMQDVVDKMNMDEITIVYGQTEASPGCTQSRIDDSLEVRVNTVGSALPGVECKVVDPETGEDLPDNVDGEFVARGYNVMKGYYKMPTATATAIDENGWLHTGDLARRLPDGNYKITGRIKDMIIRGGENIYPKEIEDFIYTHEKVKDVQVIGVPDKQYGEEIMACVILKDGETITEEELKDYVRAHMAKHKTPKYVDFVSEFPMNAAGKILKYKMREDAVVKLNLLDAKDIVTA